MSKLAAALTVAAGLAFLVGGTPAVAETLSFEQVLDAALAQSYDVRLAKIVRRARQSDVRLARAGYFPQVQGAASFEYDKSFNKNPQQTTFVGNTTITGVTRFQNVFAISANYTAIDFGQRRNTLQAAKQGLLAADVGVEVGSRDVKLAVLNFYSDALIAYKSLLAKQSVIPLYRQLYQLKKQLYESGDIPRADWSDYAIKLAQAEDEVQQWWVAFSERVKDLSALTHSSYDSQDLHLLDLGEAPTLPVVTFLPEHTPDFKMYALQIAAKRHELRAINAQKYFNVSFYSNMIWYGTNKSSPTLSLANTGNRLLTAGMTIAVPIFDGFKNAAMQEQKQTEIAQLELQRDKKVWELRSQFERARASMEGCRAQLRTKAEVIDKSQQQVGIYSRLTSSRIQDQSAALNQQIQLIEQRLSEERVKVQTVAAVRKLELISGL